MKKTRIVAVALVCCLILAIYAPAAAAAEPPIVDATSVVVADLNSDRILYQKNMDGKAAPASLTKIMTILVAVEKIEAGEFSLTDMVEAQADCRDGMDSDSSTSDIYPGEIMPLNDLLYCAMLQSANEACNIIATYMAGSILEYVRWMNDRALELGCTGTSFVNTNGLTDINHYTTAYDMTLITREAMKHQLFTTLCNTITYDTAATNVNESRQLKSSNALICSDSIYGNQYLYKGASGVKTGHTNAAGFCLISTAQKDGVAILCVVMGSTGSFETGIYGNFEDSISLYKWAFGNYSYFIVRSQGDIITQVSVDMSKDDQPVSLRPETDIRLLLPNEYEESQLTLNTMIYDSLLVAPIPAGTVLGETEVVINGESYGYVKLVNTADVELSRSELMKRQISKVVSSIWFKLAVTLFVVIIAGYLLLVVRYRKQRQKQLREKQLAEQRRRQQREKSRSARPEAGTAGSTRSYGDYDYGFGRDQVYTGGSRSGARSRSTGSDYDDYDERQARRTRSRGNGEKYGEYTDRSSGSSRSGARSRTSERSDRGYGSNESGTVTRRAAPKQEQEYDGYSDSYYSFLNDDSYGNYRNEDSYGGNNYRDDL